METKTETTAAQQAVQAAQAPAPPDPAQRPARLALYIGVALLALGALALYLGYNGTATNVLPQAQTPYIISGGLTGLALMALGAVTLGVYVLLRVTADLRGELEAMRGAMESMVESLSAAYPLDALAAGKASSNGHVIATKGTSSFHRPDCRLVTRSPSSTPMPRAEADAAGLVACRVCSP